MKLLDAEQMRAADGATITHEGISPVELMERAARRALAKMIPFLQKDQLIHVICGTGNNGGDGFAIARLLHERGYTVHAYLVKLSEQCSADCKENMARFRAQQGVMSLCTAQDALALPDGACIIDALFGMGLNRPITDWLAQLVAHMNEQAGVILSVDMPSGLGPIPDDTEGAMVRATHTFTFQLPKASFFFRSTHAVVGKYHVVDIGLDKDFLQRVKPRFHLLTVDELRESVLSRSTFDHKGSFGTALLSVGSSGMIGAAQLAARGALLGGIGRLKVHVPSCGEIPLQTRVPEAMVVCDSETDYLSDQLDFKDFQAVGMGPGCGSHSKTKAMVVHAINQSVPLVLDADALNVLDDLSVLNRNATSIITPHPGEWERLSGVSASDDVGQLNAAIKAATDHNLHLILKGAYTRIIAPNGTVWFNQTGNPGMAVGGSGDVLLGLVTGLLARGYLPLDACKLGVAMHGWAADFGVKQVGEEALSAQHILDYIPKVWLALTQKINK